MKLHPRTLPVQHASLSIRDHLCRLQEEYGLTDVEMIRVLTEHQMTVTKWMLREERHPGQPEHKADEE
jgi:hypothetical protein